MSTARSIDHTLQALFPREEGVQYWFRTHAGDTDLVCRGLASRRPSRAVGPSTTFHSFSATKPVTTLALLQLAAQGRVELDRPIRDYLPELPYRNGATIRQVLSHQAGLPNPMPLSWVHRDEEHASFDPARFVERVLHEHPTCKTAGVRTRYSNVGFLLLGRLIERIAEQSYVGVVKARILDVVRDTNAADAYLDFSIPADRHAVGYTRLLSALGLVITLMPDPPRLRTLEGGWISYRPFHLDGAAYGGLKGNARGWAPLLSAIADADARLLPAPWYERWFAPQSLVSGAPSGHALSWFVGKLGEHDYRCHAGGGPGYAAEIRVYPALRAASMLTCNTTIIRDLRLLDRLDAHWLP